MGKHIAFYLMLIASISSAQDRMDGITEGTLGPHLSLGYHFQGDNFFNTGIAIPITDGENYGFKLKPNISIGRNNIYGFGIEWFYSMHASNWPGEPTWVTILGISSIGLQPRYEANSKTSGIEVYYNINFVLADIELGYNWRFTGINDNLDNQFRIGLNIKIFKDMFD